MFSAGAVEIFRQSYTLQELRDLNNCSIHLTTKKPDYSSNNSDLEIEEYSTAKGAGHYVIDSGQDTTALETDNETEIQEIPTESNIQGAASKKQEVPPSEITRYEENIQACS